MKSSNAGSGAMATTHTGRLANRPRRNCMPERTPFQGKRAGSKAIEKPSWISANCPSIQLVRISAPPGPAGSSSRTADCRLNRKLAWGMRSSLARACNSKRTRAVQASSSSTGNRARRRLIFSRAKSDFSFPLGNCEARRPWRCNPLFSAPGHPARAGDGPGP